MIHSPRPGFYDDIKKGFFELEQQYGFEAKSLDEYEVLLSNKKCIIDLIDTEDGLDVYILNPKSTEKRYWPNLIYECIEGKTRIPWEYDKEDDYVTEYKKTAKDLIKYLPGVLKGDFSWSDRYLELEQEGRELIGMTMDLGYDHPLYKRLREQPFTWKKEARKYFGSS